MNIRIRKADVNDLDEILETENIVYPSHHWSRDSYEKELTNNLAHYGCAVNSDGKIIGHYGFWQIFEEAHITTIEVRPEYRKQKVGTAMMIAIVDECYRQMIKYITLEVRESNISAISLYDKFGFSTIGVRKKYYQDNDENALILFTENIWYDKFKMNYNKIKNEYEESIK